MIHLKIFIGVFVLLLLPVHSALANDGKDRHAGAYPTVYHFFDAPVSELAGYRVLEKDMEGGADGDMRFRWARDTSIALVKTAAHKTVKTLGVSEFPMAIFDLSSENGDTPVEFAAGKKANGRHPGGSHDGGINLDLGYYMKDMKGKYFTPDFAACTEHFIEGTEAGGKKYKDSNICNGPADRLDAARQAYFFLEIFKMNREMFENDLIEEIGIDRMVFLEVEKQMEAWIKDKSHGADQELLDDMRRVMTFDPFDGWAKYHHHHTHIRLRDINYYGKYRKSFEALLKTADAIQYELLKKSKPEKKAFLHVSLTSYRLERSIRVRIFHDGIVEKCAYRMDKSDWVEGLQYSPGCPYVFEVGDIVFFNVKEVNVNARVKLNGGDEIDVAGAISMPVQPPELFISVDASLFSGKAACSNKKNGQASCSLELTYQQPAGAYITRLIFRIYTDSGDAVELKPLQKGKLTAKYKGAAVKLITAEATLSGRIVLKIPLYINGY